MVRPVKQGIEYFTHDVNLSLDEKLEYIEAMHGIIGYATFLKLLERIYRNGYFCRWTKKEMALFSKRNNLEMDVTGRIVIDCLDEGLFDVDMYEKHQILTSRSVQRRYISACAKRKTLHFVKAYLCVNPEEHLKKGQKVAYVSDNRGLGSLKLPLEYPETPQSKEKESKERKDIDQSAKNEQPEREQKEQPFDQFWADYPKKVGKKKARDVWNRKNLDEKTDHILKAVEEYKQTDQWQDVRYIPHPATWLNQERWEDEIPLGEQNLEEKTKLLMCTTCFGTLEVPVKHTCMEFCPVCTNEAEHDWHALQHIKAAMMDIEHWERERLQQEAKKSAQHEKEPSSDDPETVRRQVDESLQQAGAAQA